MDWNMIVQIVCVIGVGFIFSFFVWLAGAIWLSSGPGKESRPGPRKGTSLPTQVRYGLVRLARAQEGNVPAHAGSLWPRPSRPGPGRERPCPRRFAMASSVSPGPRKGTFLSQIAGLKGVIDEQDRVD